MTPRTFHNILVGRNYEVQRRDAEWKQTVMMHQELVLAVLSPHMKKADRDRAYSELYNKTSVNKPKKAKLMTPEEVKLFLDSQKNKK